jgi:hypothetical protein
MSGKQFRKNSPPQKERGIVRKYKNYSVFYAFTKTDKKI